MALDIKELLIATLVNARSLDTLDFAIDFNVEHDKVVGVVKSLQTVEGMLYVDTNSKTFWELTDEGKHIVKHGSHEMQLYQSVPPEGIPLAKLKEIFPDSKVSSVGFNKAMSAGWLCVDKGNNPYALVKVKSTPVTDIVREHLVCIQNSNIEAVPKQLRDEYKKRKLIHDVVITNYILKKGPMFTVVPKKEANDLTVDMLANGSWRGLEFKPYNLKALGTAPDSGHFHPMLKMRAEIRQIFLEMGFQEMPTNNYVESSFWNFDALFQPQQHPAREAHDTFFISEPAESGNFPRNYLEKVKNVHSIGGFGSQGYGYDWKEEDARKNLLRTHTTAVSARMLYQLAKEGFRPAKFFSIDKVFRNETLDATHLAEFQQVEGVVADYNLSLGNLIGILSEFFGKLGITGLRFKPAYNPYTEPSMEIFSYHTGLGKMIEVGNSGMFRPEMLQPMGLPEDVNVIAWGLSLERPTMIKYGINNIRDLVGPKVDLQMVYNNPVCRLDKGSSTLLEIIETMEQRWDAILSDLKELNTEVKSLKHSVNETDNFSPITAAFQCLNVSSTEQNHVRSGLRREAVIFAKHSSPPYSVLFVSKLLSTVSNVTIMAHNHSSIDHNLLPIAAMNLDLKHGLQSRENAAYTLYYIWKKETPNSLVVAPLNHVAITGEVNILRYFCREYEKWPNSLPLYEKRELNEVLLIDSWLDWVNSIMLTPSKKLLLNLINDIEKRVQLHKWLVGHAPSVADIAVWSLTKQNDDIRRSRAIQGWYEEFMRLNWFGSEMKLV